MFNTNEDVGLNERVKDVWPDVRVGFFFFFSHII